MRFVLDMFDKNVMRQIVLEESDEEDEEEEAGSQPMTAKPFAVPGDGGLNTFARG